MCNAAPTKFYAVNVASRLVLNRAFDTPEEAIAVARDADGPKLDMGQTRVVCGDEVAAGLKRGDLVWADDASELRDVNGGLLAVTPERIAAAKAGTQRLRERRELLDRLGIKHPSPFLNDLLLSPRSTPRAEPPPESDPAKKKE